MRRGPLAPLSLALPVLVLLGACAGVEEDPGIDPGKADLPNDGIFDREHDGAGYQAIADYFGDHGYDLVTQGDLVDPTWPLVGETILLNRYGTPVDLGSRAYFHTAFDVYRGDALGSDEVRAPISGVAMVFDWDGVPGYHGNDLAEGGSYYPRGAYSAVIAIWDPTSHLVVELMHVEPTAPLRAPGVSFTDVVAGEVIGKLTEPPITTTVAGLRDFFRHTHVSVIDGAAKASRDPAGQLGYHDAVAPTIDQLYVLDEAGERHATLRSGPLDVVLEVHDRDDASAKNFEIASVAYELRDDHGTLLAAVPRCRLDDLYGSNAAAYEAPATDLLDLGNAHEQIDHSAWPGSDIGDPDRTFRYALTQMYVGADGKCAVLDDDVGFLAVTDDVAALEVRATLWDPSGNSTEFAGTLTRDPGPPQ